MSTFSNYKPDPKLDLVLQRDVDVPPALVWKAWTEPKHIVKWFTPAPWKTTACEIDLWPGGKFNSTFEGPAGERMNNTGCILEVDPGKLLVFTDALLAGYRPAPAPFMTAVIKLEPHGKGTRYTAIAIHKDAADVAKHEEMGFHQGWGTALDQLVALAKTM